MTYLVVPTTVSILPVLDSTGPTLAELTPIIPSNRGPRRYARGDTKFRCEHYGVPFDNSFSETDVFNRDDWVCKLCGCDVRWKGAAVIASVDHIIGLSVSESPGHVWSNVQTTCRPCNYRKGA